MNSAGYVIGAILVIGIAVFIVYVVPTSITANVLTTNIKSGLLGKEVTLDVQWVGYNALRQQLFTINEYIEYNTNCMNQIGYAKAWVDYNGLRYYAVLATINGASHTVTSSITTPIIKDRKSTRLNSSHT